ncbi:MAG: hypothetical protein WDZ43_00055 [Nitrosopumilaceae archaeon]
MTAEADNKNGRPSEAEQLEIERTLRPYFEKSISPYVTSSKTGINIKTVRKYFHEWCEEIIKSEHPDFIESSKIAKEQTILAYDEQLLRLYKAQEDIDEQVEDSIKQSGGIPKLERWLYKHQIDVSYAILNLISLKTSLANTPTADITLAKKVQELLKEYAIT